MQFASPLGEESAAPWILTCVRLAYDLRFNPEFVVDISDNTSRVDLLSKQKQSQERQSLLLQQNRLEVQDIYKRFCHHEIDVQQVDYMSATCPRT